MIQPEGIPISELNKVVSALDANVAPLSRLGQHFVDVGKNTHHAFQGLKHVYHVPKREVLISSTQKIQTNLGDFGPSLPAMSEHLTNLANEVRGKLGTLKDIRTQAYDWHRQKDGNPDWKNDQHMIDWNNKMVNDVHKIVREDIPNLCFQCANAIVALFGGKAWDPKTGLREGQAPPKDEKKNGDPPPDPWGTTEERDKPLWQDVLEFPANVALGVLQVVGETVEGLLTLVPVLPALGSIPGLRDWAKNTFGYNIPNWKDAENAWMGLRNLAVNLQTAPIQLAWWGFDKVSGRDTRPQFVKDLGAQGVGMLKGMVAWDEWSKNPGKAFGMALTNVASTAASFGAGGAIRGAAMAGKFGMASAAVVKVAKVADFASSVKVGIHDAALGAAMKIPKVSTVVDGLSKIPIVGHNFKLQGLPKVEVPTGATPDISAPPTHAGVDAPHARENTPNVDPPTVHNPHVDTSPLPTPDTPSTHRPGSDALSTHTPGTDSPSLRASARDGSHVPDSNAPASHRQGADTPGDHARSTGDRLTPPPVSRLDPGAGTRPPHVEPGTTNTPGTHTEPTSGSTTSGSRTEPTSTSPGPRTDPGSTTPSSRTPEPSTTHKPEPHTPGTTHTPEPHTPRTTHRPESNTPGTTHTPEPNTPSTTHTPEPGTHTPETSGTHTPETHTPETHTPEPGRADEMAPAAKTDPAVTPVMSMHPGVPGPHAPEAPRSPRIGNRLESKKPSIQERREGEPVPRVPRQSLAERLAGKQPSRTEHLEGVDPGTPDHTPTDDQTPQDPNTPETPQPTAGHQTQRTPHTPETPGAPHAPETPEAPGVQRAPESTMSIADRLAGRTDSPGVPREHRPSGSHLDEHAPVREHREPGTTRPAVPRPPQRSLSDILNGVDEPGPIADRTPGHTPERAVPPHRPAAEGVHRPEWQRPETHVPETHVPETHVPETHVPETHVPGSHVPEGHVPESHVPGESRVPGTHVPENHVPGSRVRGAHVPETHVPGSRAPEGRVPGAHVPGGRVSESHVPEGRGPEGHVPEAHTPGAHAPESPTPGTHAPEAHTPDADAPESRVPERDPVTGRPEDYGFEPAGEPRKVISPEGKEKYLEEYRAAAEK